MSRVATGMREKLLDAACELLIQVGYKGLKLQQVCEKAGANIASVNYYFGSKKGLYREAWSYAHSKIADEFEGNLLGCASAEEKIRQLAYFRIRAVLTDGPKGWFPKIVHREAMDPSELHDEVFKSFLGPKIREMHKLILEFMGEGASEDEQHTAMYSFQSQCIHLLAMRSRKVVFFANGGLDENGQEKLATDISEIIIGGLISYRELIKRRNNG